MAGTLTAELDNLSVDVTAYAVDGYKATITAELGTNSLPPNAGTNGVCIGVDMEEELAWKAPNGVYCLTWVSAASASDTAFSERPLAVSVAGYFHKTAAWEAFTDKLWEDALTENLSENARYDVLLLPAFGSADDEGIYVAGAEISMEFYMPGTALASAGTTTEFGDRLEDGDLVTVMGIPNPASGGTPPLDVNELTLCDAPIRLILGA